MTTRLAIITGLLAFARECQAPPEFLAHLVAEQLAATELLFQYVGVDASGRRLWRVGPRDAPVVFAAKLHAVHWLYLLARHKRVPITDIADVPTARVAARRKLERAVDEVHHHCTALADELKNFTVEAGDVRYRRHGAHIVTD